MTLSRSTTSSRLTLKALLAAAALLVFAPALSQAQQQMQPPPPQQQQGPDMDELRLDVMTAQLDLTQEQRTAVQRALTEEEQRQQAIMEEYTPQMQGAQGDDAALESLRREVYTEMQENKEETVSSLSSVLNQEQVENYRTLYAEIPEPGSQPDRVQVAIDQIDAQVGLTNQQRTDLRPVLSNQFDQMRSFQQRAQEAGQDQAQRQQLMQEYQQTQQQTQQQMEEILTEQQTQKMEEIQQAQQRMQQAQQMQRMRRQQMQQQMRERMQQQGGGQQGGGQ